MHRYQSTKRKSSICQCLLCQTKCTKCIPPKNWTKIPNVLFLFHSTPPCCNQQMFEPFDKWDNSINFTRLPYGFKCPQAKFKFSKEMNQIWRISHKKKTNRIDESVELKFLQKGGCKQQTIKIDYHLGVVITRTSVPSCVRVNVDRIKKSKDLKTPILDRLCEWNITSDWLPQKNKYGFTLFNQLVRTPSILLVMCKQILINGCGWFNKTHC